MSLRGALALLFLLGSSACTFGVPIGDRGQAQPGAPSNGSGQGNPSSYVVHGQRYFVLDSAQGFKQRGVASWYGTKFHGRRTSSGEIYNMHAMTAAHKTLPLPVHVHVKNLDNDRTAVVKVNDRGPFIRGRIIDLSFAAAKKLGVTLPGTANVEIRVVSPDQPNLTTVVRTLPLVDPVERDIPLFVQMGSFSSQLNADNLVQSLQAANESAVRVSRLETDQGPFYRVQVGPLFDMEEANAIVRRLQGKGFDTGRIIVDEPE